MRFPEHREIFTQDEGDDPGRVGRGGYPTVTHECSDCHGFKGNGLAAYEHHRQRHHRIQILGTRQLASFACCPPPLHPPDDLLEEGGADYFVGFGLERGRQP